MIELVCLGAGLLIGMLVLYLCVRPKLQKQSKLDWQIIEENQRLREDNVKLGTQRTDLLADIESLRSLKFERQEEVSTLNAQKDAIKQGIVDLESQARQAAEIFETQTMEIAQKNIEQSMERLGAEYQEAQEAYRQEYQQMIEECVANMREALADREHELAEQNELIEKTIATLTELQAKSDSAVAAAKRAEEIRTAADFYRLQLSEEDIQEIEMLRNVVPYLRDKEPLNKVIWKCYYEKPTTDLIGRVIGSGIHTGIYKITNLQNQMCYVGQAASLSDRWKQHIKRGVGADAPTRNKLYPAMIALGPENFSFEVIEECDRDVLDEREDYWQEFFKAKEFGYSIK